MHSLVTMAPLFAHLLCSALSPATTFTLICDLAASDNPVFLTLCSALRFSLSVGELTIPDVALACCGLSLQFSCRLLVATCGSAANFCSGSGALFLSFPQSRVCDQIVRNFLARRCRCVCPHVEAVWVSFACFNVQIHRQVPQMCRQTGGQSSGLADGHSFPLRWRLQFSAIYMNSDSDSDFFFIIFSPHIHH